MRLVETELAGFFCTSVMDGSVASNRNRGQAAAMEKPENGTELQKEGRNIRENIYTVCIPYVFRVENTVNS